MGNQKSTLGSLRPQLADHGNMDLRNGNIVPPMHLILEGVVTQYEDDPFGGYAVRQDYDLRYISRSLANVHCCKITHLFLHNQNLTWNEFKKLASSGMIKKLYFSDVKIKDENIGNVPLEMILYELPNVEEFAHLTVSPVKKETFKNLLNRPIFEKLQVFKLNYIIYWNFDADGFLDFMKKHPSVNFSLSFAKGSIDEDDQSEFKEMTEKLKKESKANPPGKLKIEVV